MTFQGLSHTGVRVEGLEQDSHVQKVGVSLHLPLHKQS